MTQTSVTQDSRTTTRPRLPRRAANTKVKKRIAVCYGNSRAIWDHTVLPATQQGWHSRLKQNKQRDSIKNVHLAPLWYAGEETETLVVIYVTRMMIITIIPTQTITKLLKNYLLGTSKIFHLHWIICFFCFLFLLLLKSHLLCGPSCFKISCGSSFQFIICVLRVRLYTPRTTSQHSTTFVIFLLISFSQ